MPSCVQWPDPNNIFSLHHSGQSVDEVFGDMPLYCPTKESCQSASSSASSSGTDVDDIMRHSGTFQTSIDQMKDNGGSILELPLAPHSDKDHLSRKHSDKSLMSMDVTSCDTATDQMGVISNTAEDAESEGHIHEGSALSNNVNAIKGGEHSVMPERAILTEVCGSGQSSFEDPVASQMDEAKGGRLSDGRGKHVEAVGQAPAATVRQAVDAAEPLSLDSMWNSGDDETWTSSSDFEDYVHDSDGRDGWQQLSMSTCAEVGALHSTRPMPGTRRPRHASREAREAAGLQQREEAGLAGGRNGADVEAARSACDAHAAVVHAPALSSFGENAVEPDVVDVDGSLERLAANGERLQQEGM
jgi:hypothetical protein